MKQFGPRFVGPKEAIAGTLALLALSPIAAGMVVGTIEYDWSAPVVEEAKPVAPVSLKECNALAMISVRKEEAWLREHGIRESGQGWRWTGYSRSPEAQAAHDEQRAAESICEQWYERDHLDATYKHNWVVKS